MQGKGRWRRWGNPRRRGKPRRRQRRGGEEGEVRTSGPIRRRAPQASEPPRPPRPPPPPPPPTPPPPPPAPLRRRLRWQSAWTCVRAAPRGAGRTRNPPPLPRPPHLPPLPQSPPHFRPRRHLCFAASWGGRACRRRRRRGRRGPCRGPCCGSSAAAAPLPPLRTPAHRYPVWRSRRELASGADIPQRCSPPGKKGAAAIGAAFAGISCRKPQRHMHVKPPT